MQQQGSWQVRWEGRKAIQGVLFDQVASPVSGWGSVLLGSSGRLRKTCIRIDVPKRQGNWDIYPPTHISFWLRSAPEYALSPSRQFCGWTEHAKGEPVVCSRCLKSMHGEVSAKGIQAGRGQHLSQVECMRGRSVMLSCDTKSWIRVSFY